MRTKKLVTCVLVITMLFSMSAIASAKSSASWKAAKGTPSVDGQKDDIYANAQEMKMEAVSDGDADGTAASAWAVYDKDAFYIFVKVKDSKLDDTAANWYEKDQIEFRLDNKDQLVSFYAVTATADGTVASDSKIVKTKEGYNVEFKVPYDTSKGSAKFTLQVDAAADGKRNCTLHTNEDLKDAWQNNDVFETLTFSADSAAAATTTTTKKDDTTKAKDDATVADDDVTVADDDATVADDDAAVADDDAAVADDDAEVADTDTAEAEDDATTAAPETGVVSTALLFGLGAAMTGTGAVCFKKKK